MHAHTNATQPEGSRPSWCYAFNEVAFEEVDMRPTIPESDANTQNIIQEPLHAPPHEHMHSYGQVPDYAKIDVSTFTESTLIAFIALV